MLIKYFTFLALGVQVSARRGGGGQRGSSRPPVTSSSYGEGSNRYPNMYRTSAQRTERDMCDILIGEFDDRIMAMVDIFESAGLVDYLFDDNFGDFSVVDLYKMGRDTLKAEYQSYQLAKEEAASTGGNSNNQTKPTHGTVQSKHPYDNESDERWNVATDCEKVLVTSSRFETERWFDKLHINGKKLHGTAPVNEIVNGSDFDLRFTSDTEGNRYGFDLEWKCIEADVDLAAEHYKFTCVEKPKAAIELLKTSTEKIPAALRTALLQYSADLGGPVVIRKKVINSIFDFLNYITSKDRLSILIGFVAKDHADEIMAQVKSFLALTPQEMLLELGYTNEAIDQILNEQIPHSCMMEYQFFKQFEFFADLAASSETWHDLTLWPYGSGSQLSEIGFFLRDFLQNLVTQSGSQDITPSDLFHAFNDAIEASGDFGSFKKIIRSIVVLLKHVLMFLEDSEKPCPLTNELVLELQEGFHEGPTSLMEKLKSDLVKDAFVSFFESDVVFGNRSARAAFLELGTDLMTNVKAGRMIAKNIGADMTAPMGPQGSPYGQDFSFEEVQNFLLGSIDLFIRYAYCGKDIFCDELNSAINPK